jgi:hypothetical protein
MNKLFLLLAVIALYSCASTKTSKTAITPAGDWEYLIAGTPEGDFKGIMNITKQGDTYTAKMNANGSELALEKFTWNPETKKVNGELYYSGTQVLFDATLNGDELVGDMSAGGMSFPFKATRKK